MLAIGAAEEDWGGMSRVGVVYVYQRSSSGSWRLATRLRAPTPTANDHFGFSVDLSLDGLTLKADGYGPWDPVTGKPEFRSQIFLLKGTSWLPSVTLTGLYEGDRCENTRLSGDGKVLAMICGGLPNQDPHIATFSRSADSWFVGRDLGPFSFPYEGSRVGSAIDFDGSHHAMQDTRTGTPLRPNVVIFHGPFADVGVLAPPPADEDPSAPRNFGYAIAMDRVANLLATSDITADEAGAGVSRDLMPGAERRGAVYMWVRREIPLSPVPGATALYLRSVVKSPNPDDGDEFARSLALCGNGTALAVGAESEDSNARGIDGDRTDNSSRDSGAAYLY
jgi:hypothetical protein